MSDKHEVPGDGRGPSEGAERPTLGVVIVTHNRPQLMREALRSVLEQDYSGRVEVVVVYDRSDPDLELREGDGSRQVRVLTNDRTPGLAGARNCGILALDTDLVAFCDDDDTWLPGKVDQQVTRFEQSPAAEFVTTAMRVRFGDRTTIRTAGLEQVCMQDLVRSRMAMLHSSSFMFRRTAMLDGFGLVDETIPRSMAEDWDLLLRAARRRPIEHVDVPLVDVLWGASSYFNDVWADKNAARRWLLDHHPELSADPKGAALQYGKLAFGSAAVGNRTEALRYAARASRANWREARSLVALAVVAGVPANAVQRALNKRGHGI